MDKLVAQDDREDGEIIDIDLEDIISSEGENNGDIIDLDCCSSEGESLRKRIHQLEARNLELEKIASISVNSYDYGEYSNFKKIIKILLIFRCVLLFCLMTLK